MIQALTLITVIIGGLWAYIKFVIERNLLPSVDFHVDCQFAAIINEQQAVEILIHLKNLGKSTLVVSNIRLDVLYLTGNDEKIELFPENDYKAGRLVFPRSIAADISVQPKVSLAESDPSNADTEGGKKQRGFLILNHNTFVRPGIDQIYSFTTAVPVDTKLILAWSSFNYIQKATRLQEIALDIGQWLGLIQFKLENLSKKHTVERVFEAPARSATNN